MKKDAIQGIQMGEREKPLASGVLQQRYLSLYADRRKSAGLDVLEKILEAGGSQNPRLLVPCSIPLFCARFCGRTNGSD
jgi:hypothetical protein